MEKELLAQILRWHQPGQYSIIGLAGAADLGKTFLAKRLCQLLQQAGIEASHLPLDGFLLDRTERQQQGVSGYQREAHDLEGIRKTLEQWKQGRGLFFYPYDHDSGSKSKVPQHLSPTPLLLAEGLFALDDSLLPFLEGRLFLYTTDAYLRELKLAADLVKRHYTPAYSQSLYDQEFYLYQQNIAPQRQKADYCLFLEKKWHYQLQPS